VWAGTLFRGLKTTHLKEAPLGARSAICLGGFLSNSEARCDSFSFLGRENIDGRERKICRITYLAFGGKSVANSAPPFTARP
jgi:hypothetical protein